MTNDLHSDYNLYIQYETGHMEIYMNKFFPCNISVFKKLLKIIALDRQHEKELKEKLRNYFQEQISILTQLHKSYAKKYFDNKQYAADTQRLIESGKHPNGVSLSTKEIEQVKVDLKEYKSAYRVSLSYANKTLKSKERFEKYLQLL